MFQIVTASHANLYESDELLSANARNLEGYRGIDKQLLDPNTNKHEVIFTSEGGN